MKVRKTVLAVLVILLLLFYIISMAYIESQKKRIQAMRTNSWSKSSEQTYFQSRPTSRPTPKPSSRPAPRSTSRPGSTRREIDTGPSTDGFYHAEDFYEWYKDDFSDYEEAEDYYESHGGY